MLEERKGFIFCLRGISAADCSKYAIDRLGPATTCRQEIVEVPILTAYGTWSGNAPGRNSQTN